MEVLESLCVGLGPVLSRLLSHFETVLKVRLECRSGVRCRGMTSVLMRCRGLLFLSCSDVRLWYDPNKVDAVQVTRYERVGLTD